MKFKRWSYNKEKTTTENGMMQSTGKQMDYVKSVVVKSWCTVMNRFFERHIPWQVFGEYFSKMNDQVIGVVWDGSIRVDGKFYSTYGPMSFAQTHRDSDGTLFVMVGASGAAALIIRKRKDDE